MTLKQYLMQFKDLVKEYGHLEVVHSSDDEGNSFHKVVYSPSIGIFEGDYGNFEGLTRKVGEVNKQANAVCIN